MILDNFEVSTYLEMKAKRITDDEIAKELFVSSSTLDAWKRRNDLHWTFKRVGKRKLDYRRIYEMRQGGMTVIQIADKFKVTRYGVYKALKAIEEGDI